MNDCREPTELPIIYRDEQLVAIDKPAGLLVHRSPIDRRETRFALQLLRDQIGQRVYPIHRLDKPTSGVLLFALNSSIAAALSDQFQQRSVAKTYLAVVRGYCPPSGEIDHAIRDDADKLAGLARGPAREALTRYRRLASVELPYAVDRYPSARYSLVELQPLTGRKHQLRRHMKHLGYPIIGDANHGKGVHNRFFATELGVKRLLLSCTELQLKQPISGEQLCLRAPPSGSFLQLLERFDWLSALGH